MSLGRNLLRYWRAESYEDRIPEHEEEYIPSRTMRGTRVAESVRVRGELEVRRQTYGLLLCKIARGS